MNRIENPYFEEPVLVDPNEPTPLHDAVKKQIEEELFTKDLVVQGISKFLMAVETDGLKRTSPLNRLGMQPGKEERDSTINKLYRKPYGKMHTINKPQDKTFRRIDRNREILPSTMIDDLLDVDPRLDPDPIIPSLKTDDKTFGTKIGIHGDPVHPKLNSVLEGLGTGLDADGNLIFPKPQSMPLPDVIDDDSMKNNIFITLDPITRSTTKYEDIKPWRENN